MSETTDWFGLVLLVLAMILIAELLDAARSSEHDKLRDEIAALRAEVRCFAEQEDCDVARRAAVQSREVYRSRQAAGVGQAGPEAHLDQLRRAAEPERADGHPPVHVLTNAYSKKLENHMAPHGALAAVLQSESVRRAKMDEATATATALITRAKVAAALSRERRETRVDAEEAQRAEQEFLEDLRISGRVPVTEKLRSSSVSTDSPTASIKSHDVLSGFVVVGVAHGHAFAEQFVRVRR